MKKLVTLTALLLCSFVFAEETTVTKELELSEKSFVDRLAGWYWMALSKDRMSTENQDEPTSQWVNFLNVNYRLTKNTVLATIFRFNLVDADQEDRFEELDQRLSLDSTLWEHGKFKLQSWLTVELPTSRESQADDKIARINPALGLNYKIDDYNNLFTWAAFNKHFYQDPQNEVAESERHFFTTWIVYTNKYLSEKYVFRAEYSSALAHVPGTADTTIRKKENDSLNLGVTVDINGFQVNPYVIHEVSYIKALNTLGGGLQVFKPF